MFARIFPPRRIAWIYLLCVSMPFGARAGVYNPDRLWSTPGNIPVCWYQARSSQAGLKGIIQKAVVREYARAGLRLTGWGDCSSSGADAPAIAVSLNEELQEGFTGLSNVGPTSEQPNVQIAKTPSLTELYDALGDDTSEIARFDAFLNKSYSCYFDNAGNGQKCKGTFSPRQGKRLDITEVAYTMGTLIHEFGHAVGLYHEHDRPGPYSHFQPGPNGQKGCILLRNGNFDNPGELRMIPDAPDCDSVMNYYSRVEDHTGRSVPGPPYLSKYDVITLQTAYGSRR